jgi:acetate kinase
MSLLTVNCGSTSVKLAAYELGAQGHPVRSSVKQYPSDAEPHKALNEHSRTAPQAIAHRIVHGGRRFAQPTYIDAGVMAAIEQLSALAPLHNPAALRWVRAAGELWVHAPQVAVFDTAFFRDLPRVAAEYALPARLGVDPGVLRYGFHGLAHEAMWESWLQRYPGMPGGRLITLQLGGGCSIAALCGGRPLDTSMGFSPLEGLVMATRSGDVDAAVVPYLQQRLGLSGAQVIEQLNTDSGLAGLSGKGDNPAALLADSAAQSQFAVELYCYRIRKYIGAYFAVLGGCDGIVFGGGVGEHVPLVRARALAGMEWAGVILDPKLNEAACAGSACISATASPIKVHVVAVDEESALADAAAEHVRSKRPPAARAST